MDLEQLTIGPASLARSDGPATSKQAAETLNVTPRIELFCWALNQLGGEATGMEVSDWLITDQKVLHWSQSVHRRASNAQKLGLVERVREGWDDDGRPVFACRVFPATGKRGEVLRLTEAGTRVAGSFDLSGFLGV